MGSHCDFPDISHQINERARLAECVFSVRVYVWVLRSTPIARHLSYRRSGKSNETEFLFRNFCIYQIAVDDE